MAGDSFLDVEDPQAMAFMQYATVVGGQWLLDDPNDPRIPAIRKTGNRLFGLDEKEGEQANFQSLAVLDAPSRLAAAKAPPGEDGQDQRWRPDAQHERRKG
jgi:hypothetical protein